MSHSRGSRADNSQRELNFIKRRAKTLAKNAQADGKEDRYLIEVASRFHFALPMKSRDKPMDIGSEFHGALKSEYAVRYLEKIGVAPTASNMKLVHENAPIGKCRVTAAWKSRGWIADTLYITPHFSRPGRGADGSRAGNSGGMGLPDRAAQAYKSAFSVDPSKAPGDKLQSIGTTQTTFNEVKGKFLYPWNQKHKLQAPTSPPTDFSDDEWERGGAKTQQSQAEAARARTRSQELVDEAARIVNELKTPLDVTPKAITVVQKDFARAFPFRKLQRQISDADKSIAHTCLTSLAVTRLIGLVCHFTYWHVMRAKAMPVAARLPKKESDELFTAILSTFAKLQVQMSRKSGKRGSLTTVLRPLVLLCLRTCTESILRKSYPQWFERLDRETAPAQTTFLPFAFDKVDAKLRHDSERPAGTTLVSTLVELDNLVASLLDRDRYGSHISALESTTEGVTLHQALHKRSDAPPLRRQFCSTSALVRSLFPDAERHLSAGSGTQARGGRVRTTSQRRRRQWAASASAPSSPPEGRTRRRDARRHSSSRDEAKADNGSQRPSTAATLPSVTQGRPRNGRGRVPGPDFTSKASTLSVMSRKQLYEMALKRVEARYQREVADVRHLGRLDLVRGLRS